MKYKVGDKVKVRSDLRVGKSYGEHTFVHDMFKFMGKIVTIESVWEQGYRIEEDAYWWTDEMLEPVEEMSTEEAIRLQGEICMSLMCRECPIDKLSGDSHLECAEFRAKHPEEIVKILKQWKADHEKKDVEVEFACIVRVIEDTGSRRRCVYEEDVTEVKDETFKMTMKRILEEYCKEHEGKFFTVYEEICRVKERADERRQNNEY